MLNFPISLPLILFSSYVFVVILEYGDKLNILVQLFDLGINVSYFHATDVIGKTNVLLSSLTNDSNLKVTAASVLNISCLKSCI